MSTIATTKMSSRGRVVIPKEIRKKLGLETGSQFMVVTLDDAVILKAIPVLPSASPAVSSPVPSMDDSEEILADARRSARRAGLKRSDVAAAVAAVRAKR